jgi:hypothetical protein
MVYGMVNAEPGFSQTKNAIDGFSDLILELYGGEIGHHARVAVGMATLPLNRFSRRCRRGRVRVSRTRSV